jgi:hypothetical protein
MQNWRLELTGVAKPGITWGSRGTGMGLANEEAAGRACGRVSNRTNLFLGSEPRPLSDYPHPLITLIYSTVPSPLCTVHVTEGISAKDNEYSTTGWPKWLAAGP